MSDLADSSVALSASAVETSGFDVPLRMMTPMPDLAIAVTVAASLLPFLTRRSVPWAGIRARSALSPASIRCTTTPSVANDIAGLWPVWRSNTGANSCMTLFMPFARMSLTSASAMSTNAKRQRTAAAGAPIRFMARPRSRFLLASPPAGVTLSPAAAEIVPVIATPDKARATNSPPATARRSARRCTDCRRYERIEGGPVPRRPCGSPGE